MGELVTHKIPSHRISGAYALFEVATRPGAGPPPHVQHREDESFYVLEGEYEFLSGEETLRVGEGAGRMLVSQTPGGLYEPFSEEVGKPVDGRDLGPLDFEGRPEVGKIAEVAAKYGIEIPPIAP